MRRHFSAVKVINNGGYLSRPAEYNCICILFTVGIKRAFVVRFDCRGFDRRMKLKNLSKSFNRITFIIICNIAGLKCAQTFVGLSINYPYMIELNTLAFFLCLFDQRIELYSLLFKLFAIRMVKFLIRNTQKIF